MISVHLYNNFAAIDARKIYILATIKIVNSMKNIAFLFAIIITMFASSDKTFAQVDFSGVGLNNDLLKQFSLGNGGFSPSAIGVRVEATTSGGVGMGATFQQSLTKRTGIEGIVTGNNTDMRITGLYEYFQPLVFKGWKAYVGGGGHIGMTHSAGSAQLLADIMNGSLDVSNGRQLFMGVDGIVGAQYDVPNMPINVSIDAKPALHLNNHPNKFEIGIGLSVRFKPGSGGGNGNGNGKGSGSGSGGGASQGSKGNGSSTGTGSGEGSGSTTKKGTVKVRKQENGSSNTNSNTQSGGNNGSTQTNTRPMPSPKPSPAPTPSPTPTNDNNGNNNSNGSGGDGNDNGEGWD